MSGNRNQSIIVGIDGSTVSLKALRWAIRAGSKRGLNVEVVHCWQPQTLPDLAFGSPHELARASVCMLDNEVAAALSEMPAAPPVIKTSIHGRPSAALVRAADGAALLVVGVHGRTAALDLLIGTVTRSCIKHATCPVVVIAANGDAVTYEGRGIPVAV